MLWVRHGGVESKTARRGEETESEEFCANKTFRDHCTRSLPDVKDCMPACTHVIGQPVNQPPARNRIPNLGYKPKGVHHNWVLGQFIIRYFKCKSGPHHGESGARNRNNESPYGSQELNREFKCCCVFPARAGKNMSEGTILTSSSISQWIGINY